MINIKYIVSLFLLIVMGFLFLHSELDFFTPEQHFHSSHDYCDIIDEAKTENINPDNSGILSFDLQNVIFNLPVLLSSNPQKTLINLQKTKTYTNLNILYSSFLI